MTGRVEGSGSQPWGQYIQGLKSEFGAETVKATNVWLKSQDNPDIQAFLGRVNEARTSGGDLSKEDALYLRQCVQIKADELSSTDVKVNNLSPVSSTGSISSEGVSSPEGSPTVARKSLGADPVVVKQVQTWLGGSASFSIDVIRKGLYWLEHTASQPGQDVANDIYARLQEHSGRGNEMNPEDLKRMLSMMRGVDSRQSDEFYQGKESL